ncbi:MAG TPA: hypothetical protein VNN80_25710 [Polyangiaceae bacterium]|nr:hypothetical protein [Polyangiaceae bacterium]
MRKLSILFALCLPFAVSLSCSDDDGSDVVPKGPPGGGNAGQGGSGGEAGRGGSAGASGTAGVGPDAGGGGSSPGCTPAAPADAGLDVGVVDAGGDAGAADAGGDASAPAPSIVSFASDIHPIFVARCGPCHVDLGYGGHNVGGELEAAYQDAVTLGQTLVTRIDGGGMPPSNAAPPNDCGAQGRGSEPGDPGCLTRAEVTLVQTWIDQCYPR